MADDDTLAAWAAELSRELGLPRDAPLDIDDVLDLARDAAHSVARPAAPLTTFLVGYAAGLAGGGPGPVRVAIETATRLALADGEEGRDTGPDPASA